MSARELITEHLDLWTGAVTKKSSSGRGSNSKVELTGVKKLRVLILELAIRGKLVEQTPNAEPATALLEQTKALRERLVNEGRLRRIRQHQPVEGVTKPFNIPLSWSWATLPDVSSYNPGKTPSTKDSKFWDIDASGIPWVSIADLNHYGMVRETAKRVSQAAAEDVFRSEPVEPGSILMSFKLTVGKISITEIPVFHNEAIISITPFLGINRDYLFKILPILALRGNTKRAIMGNTLNATSLAQILVPLPPTEEQHRIVQKVNELMALCDRLEQQTSDQLEAHETLVDTLLGTLTQSENATELADHWARLAAHFDTLFTTEQSIDKLKQTIFKLAVMGRLVEQDAGDGPADELVSEILYLRDKLSSTERMRTRADDNIPTNDEYLDIPNSWSWVRLGNMAKFIDYRGKTPFKINSGKRLITAKNIRQGYIDLEPEEFISETDYNNWMTRGFPHKGDLLFTPEAPLGNAAIIDLDEDFALAQRAICFQWHVPETSQFMLIQILAAPLQKQLVENATGMTATGIKASKLKEIPVVIPPLEEQVRIVQKVDELMALCDQLKERLNHASETRCQLAEVVVKGALN